MSLPDALAALLAAIGVDDGRALHHSRRTMVARGRWRDGRAVVVKTSTAQAPPTAEVARYRRERALLDALGAGVPRVVDLVEHAGRPALVLEDFGGRAVSGRLGAGPLPLEAALALLIAVAEVLEGVHRAGVVHKDLNPANIIQAPDGAAQIIDFGIATTVRERAALAPPDRLEGTLLYLAPEQTGRTHRGVDHRADLYALGATAWHLLVGRPPFEATDPLALVHAHLARRPGRVHEARPSVPPSVSAVVDRLLEKDPDARYQSAAGVVADLRRCAAGEPFTLGAADRPLHFAVPDRLYGRAAEGQVLQDALAAATRGGRAVVLVAGPAGIGKSALVAGLQGPLFEAQGIFATGRFELLGRDRPYRALLDALSGVLGRLLEAGAAERARWRARLERSLADQGAVLHALLPSLRALLGAAPAAASLSGEGARARLQLAFVALLRGLAAPSRPLLLFLDDLQWADGASLELFEALVRAPDLESVVLVGGCRPEALAAGRPLRRMVLHLTEAALAPTEIRLGPLDREALTDLVADACRRPRGEVGGLVSPLLRKTGGNPFFARALLDRLASEGHLRLTADGWGWDAAAVEAVEATPNVVEMLVAELARLPAETRTTVSMAACWGHRVSSDLLAAALEVPVAEVARRLEPALLAGCLVPESGAHRLAGHGGATAWYRFAHDRLQEAAYAGLPEEERPGVHRRLGHLLIERPDALADAERLFAVVGHLRRGLTATTVPAERVRFATLAREAGERAVAAAAFPSAHGLFEAGLEALGPTRWDHPELARGLCVGAIRSGRLLGAASLEARAAELIERCPNPIQQLPAWEARIGSALDGSRFLEAIEHSDSILRAFGRRQPRGGNRLKVLWRLLRLQIALRGRGPEELAELPEARDPGARAVQRITALTAPAQALATPDAVPLGVLRDIAEVVRNGITPAGAMSWTGYGMIRIAAFGDVTGAVRYGDLALAQVERLGREEAWPQVALFVEAYLRPWGAPLARQVDALRAVYPRSLAHGQATWGLAALSLADLYGWFAGVDLPTLQGRLSHTAAATVQFTDAPTEALLRMLEHATAAVTAAPEAEAREIPAAPAENLLQGIVRVTLSLQLALVRGDHVAAVRTALPPVAAMGAPMETVPHFEFWTLAIVTLSTYADRPPRRWLRRGRRSVRRWCRHLPSRAWRLAWIEAAAARRGGAGDRALQLYATAADQAREAGVRWAAALIAEQAAELSETIGRARLVRSWRAEALEAYRHWGATAAVARLEAAWPAAAHGGATAGSLTASITLGSTGDGGRSLDLETVLRASQALAGEIRLEALLVRVLDLAIENAGAERGLLIRREGGTWRLAAQSRADEPAEHLDRALDLDDPPLPMGLLRRVARLGEPVMLGDARREGDFTQDPYVLRAAPRSVLCLPMIDRGALAGVLYLENSLVAHAFAPARLEVLRALSGQMAVSLTNAQLYADALALTRAYERFVPKEFLALLGKERITDVALGDQVAREMTVLFSDIRGFTTLSERMSPEENFAFVNAFLGHMEPVIGAHGGFIDKYIGDAIMALFPGPADAAVRAGVGMLQALEQFNAARAAEGEPPVNIGVGLNSGWLMLGTVGGRDRMDGTVISDAVNLAARIEGLTKGLGARLLISASCRDALEAPELLPMRPVDRVRVKGKAEPVDLFEVFGADPPALQAAKRATLADFNAAVEAFRAGDLATARARVEAVLAVSPDDPAARLYAARCARFAAEGLPPGWDGVVTMRRK